MHPFDADIANVALSRPHLKVNITDNWSINGVPNGGYLMAVLANAMLQQGGKKATPIVTANFMSRCVPGEALLTVEKIASSNQFDRFQAILTQDGNEKIRAFGTFAAENKDCSVHRYESLPPELLPVQACVSIPAMPNYNLFARMDVRLDPGSTAWMSGRLNEKSEHKGWIRFREERPFDPPAILLIADSFPPPVFASQGMVAWVPTIEFSVNIRGLPKTKWLKGVFRTRFITCGLLEEDGELWDETGELVSISRQIAQYRANP